MAAAKMKNIFRKYPIMANSIVYGTLYTGAEFCQQTYNRKFAAQTKQDYDLKSLGRFALFGTTIGANVLYQWYRWLDRKLVGTAAITVVKKLALDQFILTPPLIASFYTFMSIMERKENVFEECQMKILPTFMTSCVFWIPAQAINFLLIPPSARVIYVGSCAFIWINVISWFKRQDFSKSHVHSSK